ncbi:GIY-YIG nuclease family protein [Microbulbifer hydrolyticus]|uniref:Endonuclease n=1 Tax=Microbulbifer hydrolyticus TaxID=48074 RepID=A0A6P1TCP8_9GAMM|nr:GIY-YIG nuclease family protein [Microbulbifer hydrolyticus]MBB5209879.1 putative endonuclease [Microbulbifer hydrolyticus]QHQ39581.1 GIY-YIG nuclease family protein [Microbulbifer hydrolyticus]
MSGWFVYLIRTNKGTLYTGVTRNVARRFEEHDSGGPRAAKALRGRGPLELAFQCAMRSKSDALKLEVEIKRWPKRRKEQLIATGPAFLVEYLGPDYQGMLEPS